MVSKDVRMSGMQTGETRWEPGLCLWEAKVNFLPSPRRKWKVKYWITY